MSKKILNTSLKLRDLISFHSFLFFISLLGRNLYAENVLLVLFCLLFPGDYVILCWHTLCYTDGRDNEIDRELRSYDEDAVA